MVFHKLKTYFSPACTELEVVVLDWLAKFLRLPQHFQHLAEGQKNIYLRSVMPTICIAILGTTFTCAYDDIKALAQVCQRYQIWLHVDAEYAGATLALEKYTHLMSA